MQKPPLYSQREQQYSSLTPWFLDSKAKHFPPLPNWEKELERQAGRGEGPGTTDKFLLDPGGGMIVICYLIQMPTGTIC